MEQEGPSFWADIKKYEETLEKDPNSYCFAPLSELYRKLGMIDDAITIARRGCEMHPEYVGGYIALGRGYYEKGMNTEAREALEKVVRVTPDNLLAQRILSKIYMDSGNASSAEGALNAILAQNPEDTESRMLLDSLIRTSTLTSQPIAEPDMEEDRRGDMEIPSLSNDLSSCDDLDDIIDLEGCEIIEDLELEHEETSTGKVLSAITIDSELIENEQEADLHGGREPEAKDPLTTVTLAELYVAQGYPKKALQIFRELLETDPENIDLKNRILALKKEIDQDEDSARGWSKETDFPSEESVEPGMERPGDFSIVDPLIYPQEFPPRETMSEPVSTGIDVNRADTLSPEFTPEECKVIPFTELVAHGETATILTDGEIMAGIDNRPIVSDEHIVRTLEIWLENIKRRR